MSIDSVAWPAELAFHELADAETLATAMAQRVARALQAAIEARGRATLVVSGGRSPAAFFECLAEQPLEWERLTVVPADERWVPPGHPDSNAGLVRRHLLRGRAVQARFVGLYQPADSHEAAARLADAALAGLSLPIDVLVLGMGEDGHTASLFPGSPNLDAALDPACPRRCLPMLAPGEPRRRLTLTLPLLASARSTLLQLQGDAKLATLRATLAGEDARQMPIRAFLHSPLEIYWCR
ncbi:6-phosphogluconolactonase [Azotobacter vinelandii CA]|uniref:6-phosphogluconolactonase n=2 Tax=Azotobacter vinelandii TaxID=354 RepID=C1DRP8_AZOVD|nr:6-phosphogluconolactonase [Azotobacter vinelandii]ACO77786.1 6-phosphogluconolactonase [Azotobacter vinelandii DJ]AGK13840.1 6-phosphogluconolactonase [Azotobacter vinelandii CA]AGK18490.1 6-phosphogluconolactonase [Azotobacter vinelandii CA6]SFX96841.1 6-phosphogluconolactonase [Azotobacter vinelandii]GLK59547.1 6-phosphogluconolactonase [Azotobacter vinelandii]